MSLFSKRQTSIWARTPRAAHGDVSRCDVLQPRRMSKDPKYDVAISFLARDEVLGRELSERLEGALNVFFFPHKQEELVGTNGLESMREPFFKSRVVVVMYREPWGQTPWTRVEESAIGERCLSSGWDGLVFVNLDRKGALPKWLPSTHVRFNMEDYGLDQLVGVIKARVQQYGGTIARPDAMTDARRVQRTAKFAADRERLRRDAGWIESQVHRSVEDTIAEVMQLVERLNKSEGFDIRSGAREKECVLRYRYVSFSIYWRQTFFNHIDDDDTDLRLAEFSGAVLLPGEQGIIWRNAKRLREHYFKPEVSETRELVWVESTKERFAPSQLADRIMRIFLDLVSRANEGKVQRPTS